MTLGLGRVLRAINSATVVLKRTAMRNSVSPLATVQVVVAPGTGVTAGGGAVGGIGDGDGVGVGAPAGRIRSCWPVKFWLALTMPLSAAMIAIVVLRRLAIRFRVSPG